MRILFQSRVDLFNKRGGDTVQVEQLQKALGNMGVKVDIDLSTKPNLEKYDLVNIFNLDWCRESYLQAVNAKIQEKPIVLSAIHHSLNEMNKFEKKARFGVRRLTGAVFGGWYGQEYLKQIYRAIFDIKKIKPTLIQFSTGIKKQQIRTLKMSNLVFVQTEKEADDIKKDFGLNVIYKKVINGVDESFAKAKADDFIEKYKVFDFILCVGRIEPRKNQLAIADAVSKLRSGAIKGSEPGGLNEKKRVARSGQTPEGHRVNRGERMVFIGKYNWNHPEYIFRFKKILRENPWITHISYIPYSGMGSAYAASKVSVNASWFETTGLVSLEAALAGSSVVASGERAKEYLGNFAQYCQPDKIDSIKSAITRALNKRPSRRFKDYILSNYTWKIAAKQSFKGYKEVLGKR